MRSKTIFRLAAALLMCGAAAAVAQQSGSGPAPAAPAAGANSQADLTPAQRAARRAARGENDSFRPRNRELLYVTEPGSLEQPGWHNGVGIIVLDVNDGWKFVKRIPTWEYAGSMSPEQVSGVAASPVTNMIYVAARGRLGAFDMATDKMVWSTALDGKCCERPQVTPDGNIVVVGGDLQDYWYEVDAHTGKFIGYLHAPESPNSHNLNLSADGKLAFMSPNNKVLTISDVKSRQVVRTIRFADNIRVQALNNDSSRIYVNNNNLMGYVVADTKTGEILKTVEVTSEDWKSVWNATPRPRIPHGCPSHGIAITPDGKEIWLADGIFNRIHIFSNTDDPKEIDTINSVNGRGPFWMTFGLDEKYAYMSSGDIVDIKTHKVVGAMKDEYGRPIYSEKLLDISFRDGHAQRVSNQFANQFGDYQTAEERAGAPHVTPLGGEAPIIIGPMSKDPNAGMKQGK